MARKRVTEEALVNVLETAVELLEEADDFGGEGTIAVSSDSYKRLRAAVKEATGMMHGIAPEDDNFEPDEVEDYDD